jgi:hypothetical protein
MNSCHFCKCVITRSYFRVGSVMACPQCVAKEAVEEKQTKWKYFWRGVLFGVPAAIISSLILWGVYEFSTMESPSLFSPGAYLRGTTTLFTGFLIGAAMKAGAKNRSSQELQICALVLTYFAYAMAIVPFVLGRLPSSRMTAPYVFTLILVAPANPFLAAFKSPVAITGLIVLFIALCIAWSATGVSLAVKVDGPFDCTDPHAEKPLFRGLGG